MEILKKLRAKLGISQSAVAKALGISQQAYANYENGNRQPDNVMLNTLANYFNVSTDYLLGRDENEQKNTHLSETERRVQKFYEEHPIMYDLVDAISRLDKEQQKALLEYAEFQAQKYKQKD